MYANGLSGKEYIDELKSGIDQTKSDSDFSEFIADVSDGTWGRLQPLRTDSLFDYYYLYFDKLQLEISKDSDKLCTEMKIIMDQIMYKNEDNSSTTLSSLMHISFISGVHHFSRYPNLYRKSVSTHLGKCVASSEKLQNLSEKLQNLIETNLQQYLLAHIDFSSLSEQSSSLLLIKNKMAQSLREFFTFSRKVTKAFEEGNIHLNDFNHLIFDFSTPVCKTGVKNFLSEIYGSHFGGSQWDYNEIEIVNRAVRSGQKKKNIRVRDWSTNSGGTTVSGDPIKFTRAVVPLSDEKIEFQSAILWGTTREEMDNRN